MRFARVVAALLRRSVTDYTPSMRWSHLDAYSALRSVSRQIEEWPQWRTLLTAVVAVLAVGIVDHVSGPITSLAIFYLIPVAATAWYVGLTSANLMALFAALTWAIADRFGPLTEPKAPLAYWDDVSLLAVFLFTNAMVSWLRRSRQRENEMLAEVQRRFLPQQLGGLSGLDLGARWIPAWTVAGDYYDAFELEERSLALCLGDVSGKGMRAALVMSNVQAMVHVLAAQGMSPDSLVAGINAALSSRLKPGTFVTFFFGVYEARKRTFRYANAGHNPPVLIRADHTVERLGPTGPVAGVFPAASYSVSSVPLEEGDRLVLFSDGVTEHRNESGEEFGEVRLIAAVVEGTCPTAESVCDAVLRALQAFSSLPFEDDVTILVLTAKGRDANRGSSPP